MENATTQKTESATDLTINPNMVSETNTATTAKKGSPPTSIVSKSDPHFAIIERAPPSDSSVTPKTGAAESNAAWVTWTSFMAAHDVANTRKDTHISQTDADSEMKSAPVQTATTVGLKIKNKTEPDNISADPKRVNMGLGIDVKDTTFSEEKVNSGVTTINIPPVDILSNNISSMKSPSMDTTASPKTTSPTATVPNISKASPAVNNKENMKFNHTNSRYPGKGAAVSTTKSPSTSTAESPPSASAFAGLRAECQDRRLSVYGSSADLTLRLAKHYAREKEFLLKHEEQEKWFAKEREDKVQLKKDDTARHASRASSQTSGSNTPNLKSPIVPSPSNFSNTPRPNATSSPNIRSPNTPHIISPSARPFVPQDIRLQQNGAQKGSTAGATWPLVSQDVRNEANFSQWKSESIRPSRFASQDVRLDPNYKLSETGAATTVGLSDSQWSGRHQVTKPEVNPVPLRTASKTFVPQDVRRYQEIKPTSTDKMKVTAVNQAMKPANANNVKVFKTNRETDMINFLHKHTHEIKTECQHRGFSAGGGRKAMATRLLDQHLNNLRAEFIHARDEYAKNSQADSEALLQKDILWYRLECFTEHRKNQIGLAGEPHRAASYKAANECKYASPRFAKIMGDELNKLIAREQQLEDDKAKTEVVPGVASKEMDSGVKLEPIW